MPEYYLTEVIECETNEVSYSYEMQKNVEKGIIPCGGRKLKKACYQITVRFIKPPTTNQTILKIYLALNDQKNKIMLHKNLFVLFDVNIYQYV